MGRKARDSQIVNNFFTLASILMVAATLAIYVKYFSKEDDGIYRPKPLVCEKKIYTYSKTFNQKLLNKSIKALNKGYYKLDGGFIESEYMKSNIKDIISLEELDTFYKNAIKVEPKKDLQKFLKIKYEIIENDKENPNKKSKDCRLHAGSIQTSFRINSKEIFRIYTDFNFMYKNAIKERIDCSIKVFKNHVQNSSK